MEELNTEEEQNKSLGLDEVCNAEQSPAQHGRAEEYIIYSLFGYMFSFMCLRCLFLARRRIN